MTTKEYNAIQVADLTILINRLNNNMNIKVPLDVDIDNAIVNIGKDTFYIQHDKLKEYLDIVIEKYTMLVDAQESTELVPIGTYLTEWNKLTLSATKLYRRKENDKG